MGKEEGRGEGGMSKNEPGRKVSDQNKLVSLDTFANFGQKGGPKWLCEFLPYCADMWTRYNMA